MCGDDSGGRGKSQRVSTASSCWSQLVLAISKYFFPSSLFYSFCSSLGSYLTPLHVAALGNELEVAKVLVKHGADCSARGFRDGLRGTPLDMARAEDHREMVRYLEVVSSQPRQTNSRKSKNLHQRYYKVSRRKGYHISK